MRLSGMVLPMPAGDTVAGYGEMMWIYADTIWLWL